MSRKTTAASRVVYDTPSSTLERSGFRVLMEDECGNPVATSKPMTLGEAIKAIDDWRIRNGRIVISVPQQATGATT